MRSIKIDKLVANRCYKDDSRGQAWPETMSDSAAFFHKPGWKHAVVPDEKEYIQSIKSWNDDLIRLHKKPKLPLYVCRSIVWRQRGWFILSMLDHVFDSLIICVVEDGYLLSERSFELEDDEGNTIMFPFHSPQFRMLRPQRLLLEQPQLLLE